MKKILLLCLLVFTLALSACGTQKVADLPSASPSPDSVATPEPTPEATPTPEPKKEYLVYETLDSTAIKANLVEEKSKRMLAICLPPSYYEDTNKRYPVIYFMHGHGEGVGHVSSKSPTMLKLMKEGTLKEVITVEADCGSVLGGSFYANSPVTGGFEDFYINELVPYIDGKYRTIANSSSRGISGFSMGGFGAMYIGFRHPDVFSAIYALGPGLFDPNGVKSAIDKSWDTSFENNYGAVFSPNTTLPFPYANIPAFDGSDADNQIIADWYNGFGNWEQKIIDYKALPVQLKAIKIQYGTNDNYPFIKDGSEYVAKLLNDAGIVTTLETFAGGHNVSPAFVAKELLPFFEANLTME